MGKFSREKKKPEKLNITSLMDALTIILIFLLVNYSDVNEEKDLPKFIELPKVESKIAKSEFGIVVVIGEDKIKVGKEKVINYSNFESESESILSQIKDELEILKKEKASRVVATDDKKAKKIKLSIQADKSIQYKHIDSIIETATELSLNYIDFVSLNKEES